MSSTPLPIPDPVSREALLDDIQREIPVRVTTTEIAGRCCEWLHVIDPDALLEKALTNPDRSADELDPFWAATWRAAIGMDRFLANLAIRNERVLELGSGSGRAGIAAAIYGAKVWMTDAATDGLKVARWNAWPFRHAIQFYDLNWRDGTLPGEPFRWILGSDVVYDPTLWPILEPCVRRHLANNGRWIVSEPQRQTGDRFLTWIREKGWSVEASLIDLGDAQREIRIMVCQPRS